MTSSMPTSREQLITLMKSLPEHLPLSKWADAAGEKPRESLLIILGSLTVLFFMAERDHNDKVEDITDALEYCTSSLNVGYTDIYPQTPLGKIVGSILMTIGPSLVTNLLPQNIQPAPPDATQEEILTTLKAILARLDDRQAA